MAEVNLQDIHDTLLLVAFEAGRMIMAANPNEGDQATKLNCEIPLSLIAHQSHRPLGASYLPPWPPTS